jgi:hypothetical protein
MWEPLVFFSFATVSTGAAVLAVVFRDTDFDLESVQVRTLRFYSAGRLVLEVPLYKTLRIP